MDLKFRTAAHISKPVEEVFEAVVDPKKLSGYFTTGGAIGRLEQGSTVTWEFHDYPGAFPVEVGEVIANEKIVLQWEATEDTEAGCNTEGAGYQTLCTMEFKSLDEEHTLVTITEEGWKFDETGLKASYGNCEGWTQMLCALKAWIEYGINLRDGYYI